ncbi:hypothetical protein PG994_003553 [Apiospora phragmitis]|uniref:Uncharacterized protein n=1 Tax=Apiospora phragmitis TaxID=2905665 RepID=A0ABR1W138_9PEZI
MLFDIENEEQEGTDMDDDDDGEFGKPHKKRKRTTRPKKQQKPFPFQSLPAELRNTIYALVLTDPRGGSLRTETTTATTGSRRPCLATCKAIHAEAAPMLYGQRFVARDGFALMAFLMQLSPASVARLRRVALHDWIHTRSRSGVNLPAVALLRDAAPGLERLEILTPLVERFFSYHGYYRDERRAVAPVVGLARMVYRNCHPLLYAVLQARGGFDAVLDVVGLAGDDWEALAYGRRGPHFGSLMPPMENLDLEVRRYKDLYAEELRRLMMGSS